MKNRNLSIDLIKAVCAIFVIITHLLSDDISRQLYSRYWLDLAVPIFLIVMGYNYKKSCENRNISSAIQWFKWSNFQNKFKRILLPYICALLVLFVILIVFKRLDLDVLIDQIKFFQVGPGSYYIFILLQVLIVFPILYFTQKKWGRWISILYIILQLFFEYYANKYWISESIYQLISIRYIIFLIAGINLDDLMKTIKWNIWMISFICGILYIYIFNYSGYNPFLFRLWTLSSMPTVIYCLPVVIFFIHINKYLRVNQFSKLYGTIGKASYHIFLVQMVYFAIGITYNLLRDVPLCVFVGIIFYYVEEYVNRIFSALRNKRTIE